MITHSDGRELVTIRDAMLRIAVSRRTLYNWLKAGKLEHVRTAGGRVRIFAEALTTKARFGWGQE